MGIKTTLIGKIQSVVQINGQKGAFWSTFLACPAPDLYSQPESYKLKSDYQLGQPGEEIRVEVAISGFVNAKPYQDKKTGQQKVFWDQVINFDVVQKLQIEQPRPVAAAAK